MFILTTIESDIRVHPKDLNKPPLVAVTDVIEQQYLDKVIPDLGLPVTIYDVQNIEGGHVYPNDGAAYFKARFRLVVFRPFVGEVLVGTLTACHKDGCKVSLGFFSDVVIPDYALQNPSFFHDTEKVWYWQYMDDKLPMDPGQEVRFRVTAIRFNPMPTAAQQAAAAAVAAAAATPAAAAAGAGGGAGAAGGAASAGGAAAAAAAAGGGAAAAAAGGSAAGGAGGPLVYSPMEIFGDIDGDGLGLTEWWLPAQEEAEEAGEAAAEAAAGEDVDMEALLVAADGLPPAGAEDMDESAAV